MRFLFSGAKHSMSAQSDKTQSLGGYMSSTQIPNGRPGALFSSLSIYAQKNKIEETLAFFIYNDTVAPITNLSIQQVYQDILGSEENQAEFEWAVVEPTADHQMELIGTSREIPFNADFFNPTSKRESCILKIITPATAGETFTLLGENIIFVGSSIEDMIAEIIGHFINDARYTIEKYSNNSIYIRREELLKTDAVVQITTIGSAESNIVNFNGYVDGETVIADNLDAGKSLGVWIKRKVKPQLEIDFEEELLKEETVDIYFSFD